MSNFLRNGTILPSGLLSYDPSMKGAFKKTYQNNSLKVGVITATYEISDEKNLSKLFPEYDVLTFEQDENSGSTVCTYRNCPASSSLGGLADFFEMSLRKIEKTTTPGPVPQISGHNGSVVLLLCLNGLADTGVIMGALSHPDRQTTITTDAPHLEGEYNGVHIVVNSDGSTSLTFKGATDNNGDVIDSSQGDTVMSIAKDGSYQVMHKTITQTLAKSGAYSLTTTDDISNTTKTNFNVTTTKNVNINATGDFVAAMNNLTLTAQGSAQLQCQKLSVQSQSDLTLVGQNLTVQAEAMAGITAPTIALNGQVSLGGSGGLPLLTMTATIVGVGNLGIPVLSYAISGFTLNVTGQ